MNKSTRTAISLALLTSLALSACSREPEAPSAPAQEMPAPAPATPTIAGSFSIGEYSAIPLRDGGMDFPNDNKIIGFGKKPEDVAELLGAAGLPTDKVSLTVSPLLVKTSDRVLLFDAGAGSNLGPTVGLLPKSMADAGIDAATVTDIFISHSHGDHVGGLMNAEGALAFPNATIHISAPEWEVMQGRTAGSEARPQNAKLVAAIQPKVAAFEPGAELVPGVVKAVELRGHTPGHSGYMIGSGANSLLYIGDAMHHHVVSVQKPDWPIGFDHDGPTAQKSRADLLASSFESGQRLYVNHFPFPSVGTIGRNDAGYVWSPAN